MEENNQKVYEISFLIKTEAELAFVQAHLNNIKAEIVDNGTLSSIKLAYPIEKNQSGYFGFIHFKAIPEAVVKLNQDMRFDKNILRYLIITPPPAKQEKRPASAPRGRAKKESKSEITNDILEEKLAALKTESGI